MEYFTTSEASKHFGVSVSSIKRAINSVKAKKLEALHLKKGKLLNTGLHQWLISVDYLEQHFHRSARPTEKTSNEPQNDLQTSLEILQNENEKKQDIIDKLLINQTKLIENERNFQILLERANQRAELLEQHFDKNKSKEEPTQLEQTIKETQQETVLNAEEIPTDRATFNEWLKSFN